VAEYEGTFNGLQTGVVERMKRDQMKEQTGLGPQIEFTTMNSCR
jgi:hypothetical protein